MDDIKSLLIDIKNKKFQKGLFKINDTIKEDKRFATFYDWFNQKYVKDGMGIKSIIKDYDLPITYSSLRNILLFLKFPIHSNTEANDFLKKRRSLNAKINYQNKTGFFKEGIQESIHHSSISRGIQGYYWNSSKNKYVWLRSSWEFIYAKWLNKQKNIVWDVECEQYKLSDSTSYRPDFFIFDGDKIQQIVEIKGYWKNRVYKVDLLREEYSLPIVLITDIKPYCENSLNEEISLWKKLRKSELRK